ncbi:hypothetical protein Mgra_00001595 [Meloidogyne graminicola]|uniref:Coiled-coil domain-containing protein n=1 Tax=Meloidogyne graminicola TaxID=189291 RepID=A0A8T0A187_9BILA|nr:hypothetical protein Mgra_00001595 [Meloidogyne graminicola]
MSHNRYIKTSINKQQQLFDDKSHLSLNRQLSKQLAELETNFVQQENLEEKEIEKPIAIVEEDEQQQNNYFYLHFPQNNQNIEWTELREFRVKEINEIRQRAAHMENTMRWWLLSAEGWRQKWLSIRNERNRLKEENTRLKKELIEIKLKMNEIIYKK